MEAEKAKQYRKLIGKAMKEMEKNQGVILERGDLVREEDHHLYKKLYDELKYAHDYLDEGGSFKRTYRYLQMNVFMPNETFLMDVLETQKFPYLFETFEYE